MSSSCWTPDRVIALGALWKDGLSAAQIAQRLGGVTRNAVIGKIHRLGLAVRPAASPPPARSKARGPTRRPSRRASAPPPRPPSPALALAKPGAAPARLEAVGPLVDLARLTARTCHWPVGDPKAADFGFCARPIAGLGPYCGDHRGRAYRTASATATSGLRDRRTTSASRRA